MSLIVLIGASGSGKTTLARAIEQRHADAVDVFYFDRIGVPSEEQMIAECGSGEAWQRARTIEWMVKLAALGAARRPVLFEAQTRLAFLQEGAQAAGNCAYTPILVDCEDEIGSRRLVLERKQPELANERMMSWARYLRREAQRHGCEVLDTSILPLEHCIRHVLDRLNGRLGSADRATAVTARN